MPVCVLACGRVGVHACGRVGVRAGGRACVRVRFQVLYTCQPKMAWLE